MMRVLFATDGSEGAKAAAEWLQHLPLPADRPVMVVTVIDPPLLPALPDIAGGIRAKLVADARRLADETALGLSKAGHTATGRVAEGDPREEIVEAAKTFGADLVVLGARGLGAMEGLLLGSVSLAVARRAPCPVLICKGTARDAKSITVALDGSEHARRALAWLLKLPLPAGLRLQLVGVAQPQHYPSTAPAILHGALGAAVAAVDAERRAVAEKECRTGAVTAHGQDIVALVDVQKGRPAEVIVQAAEQHGSDLIVVGARGLGRLERLRLGSVSEAVLRSAHCPVLIVRPPATGASS
jgi:nucleotide-binding universal stress UspA family protein